MIAYRGNNLVLDYYPHFLTTEEATGLFNFIETRMVWSKSITPGKRVRRDFGDPDTSYTFSIRGKTITRVVDPWDQFPVLLIIKERLEILTGQKYSYCVVQRYPSGRVGINPHRDKEMVHGSIIAGVSLGTTRRLTMSGSPTFSVDLGPGSLYLFRPPTNDCWAHSIEKNPAINEPRISLTFRQQ